MKRFLQYLFFTAFITLFFVVGCRPKPYATLAKALELPAKACSVNEQAVTVSAQGHLLQITRGKRPAKVDHILYYLHQPAGEMMLSEQDTSILKDYLHAMPLSPKTIILDPGHGGNDTGCRMKKVYEKTIVLNLALRLKHYLSQAGYVVYLTRTDDKTTLSLDDRTNFVATHPADLFISLHVNSAANPEAKGLETYTIPAENCEGTNAGSPPRQDIVGQQHVFTATRLALATHKALLLMDDPPADRGVKHAYFKVLRDTPIPAILIETGFITHPEDLQRLTDPQALDRMAQAITRAIKTL